MKNSVKILFWTLLSALFAIGCSETPSDLGSDILNDDFGQDIVTIKLFDSQDVEDFDISSTVILGPDSISSHSSNIILFGKIDNLTSKCLLKFGSLVPDTVLTPLNKGELTVESAKLFIKPQFIVGNDDQSQFQFSFFELKDTINRGLKKGEFIDHFGEDLISNIESTDTLITADVSTDLITKWLKEKNQDSTANYGVLVTAENSVNNVVRVNTTIINENHSNFKIEYIVVKDGTNWRDTLTYNPGLRRTITDGTLYPASSETFQVQGGIPVRTNYTFDKEKMPKNIAVNNARLQFFVDEGQSVFRKTGSDTLMVTLFANAEKDSLDPGWGSALLTKADDGKSFEGNVTAFVQRLYEKEFDFKFRISSASEKVNVSRIVLKNHLSGDNAVKPKLTLKYSKRNK